MFLLGIMMINSITAQKTNNLNSQSDVISFSTSDIAQRERSDFWTESMKRFCGPCKIEYNAEGFNGRLIGKHIHGLNFAKIRHNARKTERTRRELSHIDPNFFHLYLQVAGQSHVTESGSKVSVNTGDLILLDAAKESQILFDQENESLYAIIPKPFLQNADESDGIKTNMVARGPSAMMLGSLLRAAFSDQHALSTAQSVAINNSIIQMIGATWQSCQEPIDATGPGLLRLIQEDLLGRLSTNHTPNDIANAYSVSVRCIHRLFSDAGTTLGEWLRESRLERCARDLRDPAHSAENITEIAFRWGFNESAHFSRCFKAAFGYSPRDYRARAFSLERAFN
jgi:AraC-like DNA-binding protein